MTLNILSLSIMIKKRKMNRDEAIRQEMAERIYDQYQDHRIIMYHLF